MQRRRLDLVFAGAAGRIVTAQRITLLAAAAAAAPIDIQGHVFLQQNQRRILELRCRVADSRCQSGSIDRVIWKRRRIELDRCEIERLVDSSSLLEPGYFRWTGRTKAAVLGCIIPFFQIVSCHGMATIQRC